MLRKETRVLLECRACLMTVCYLLKNKPHFNFTVSPCIFYIDLITCGRLPQVTEPTTRTAEICCHKHRISYAIISEF